MYMGLFVNQNSNRSKLQERLAAELTEKAKKKAELDGNKLPDGVEDSNYIKDTKMTTSLAWVWILIVVFVVVAAIAYMFMLNS
jgi:Flp pilus assembly protein TadB